MMKTLITILAFLILTLTSDKVFSQVSFGIHAGTGLKSAYFGYNINPRFMPYVSLQFQNNWLSNSNSQNKNISNDGLILPTIGTKYYMKNNGKLKPYFDVSILKPIFYKKPNNDFINQKNEIKKPNLWSGGLGFGTEYFLYPQFSLGGEFGGGILFIRNLNANSYSNYGGNLNNIYPYYHQKITNFVTYGGITVNFYFEKE
jgi:hypothetical protein